MSYEGRQTFFLSEIYPLADEAFRFLYLITGERGKALDHLSSVYEKIYSSMDEAITASDIRVYIFSICWNDAREQIGKQLKPDTANHPELSIFLSNYTSEERVAMIGIDILGLEEHEVTKITGWPKDNLLQYLEKGREKLQNHHIE